ncbi:MAG: efflux transporter outer membrane subunit [Lysobacterales bacterium]|nr:MAG: efflux transporter outer membrane subunit [Xanthomonadales bacterium]
MILPHRLALLLPVILLLPACALGPEPRSPSAEELGLPSAYLAGSPQPAGPVTADLATWWTTFDDPTLARLVDRSLEANTDLDAAAARVRQARASLVIVRAGLWPSLGVGATAAVREADTGSFSLDATTYTAGFDAAYEVDLFGGTRRSIEASTADLAAVEASRQSVRISVVAEVALNYLDARLAQQQFDIARQNLAAQDETLQIVEWRVMAGLVGQLDLEQARRLRAQTAAALPLFEQSLASATNRLAVLTVQSSSAVEAQLGGTGEIPLAAVPDAGIPAELLRRRPDVLAAERTLVADIALIGVREADLYPALRLTGSFGGAGTSLGNTLDAAVGALAAGLTAPIFEGGRLRAAVEQQRAAADASLANYHGTVLAAIEETENALVAADVAARREVELVVALEAARNAVLLARNQYQAGLIDFQTLLDSERSLLTTEDSRLSVRAARSVAAVQLYKALGGGWNVAPAEALPAVSDAARGNSP